MTLAKIGKKRWSGLSQTWGLDIDCRDENGRGMEMQFCENKGARGVIVAIRTNGGPWAHTFNRDDTIDKVIARFQKGNDDEIAGRCCGNCGEPHHTIECPYPKNGGL